MIAVPSILNVGLPPSSLLELLNKFTTEAGLPSLTHFLSGQQHRVYTLFYLFALLLFADMNNWFSRL